MLCLSGFELYSRWVPLNFCCETRRSLLQTAYNHEGVSQQPV